MSYETIINTDAPIDMVIEVLTGEGIVSEAIDPPGKTFQYFRDPLGALIVVNEDPKAEINEMETWVAVDERNEDLIAKIFDSIRRLPYKCLRGPTATSPEEIEVIPPNALPARALVA